MSTVKQSKTLSYLLRHGAVKEGLPIRPDGFIPVSDLLQHRNLRGTTMEAVREIVRDCPKQRFQLIQDEQGVELIRASQGHSIKQVNQDQLLTKVESADAFPIVVHGTKRRAWTSIQEQGLKPMGRQHVHFATGLPSDNGVISGMRNSSQVLVFLNLAKAMADGIPFYVSDNGVVLSPGDTNGVILPKYFERIDMK